MEAQNTLKMKLLIIMSFLTIGLTLGYFEQLNVPKKLTLANQTVKLWPANLQKGRFQEKTQLLDKTLELDHLKPRHFSKKVAPLSLQDKINLILQKAQNLLEANKTLEAEVLLIESLHQFPKHFELRLKLADYYKQTNRITQAQQILEAGLHYHCKKCDYLLELSEIYHQQGFFEKAVSLLLDAPEEVQKNQAYVALLASCYYQAGLYQKAKQAYHHLLQFNNHNSRAWLGLALSAQATGDFQTAQAGFTTVKKQQDLESDVLHFVETRLKDLALLEMKMAKNKGLK